MFVIGTAGHVDHGKSLLVQALTGIDPDRLREEKERAMTIDLGFAWLELPSGREVSIVDVPGHERFVRNMLAGVGGIDLALLVIAADEGVMPQTREHLAILDLLGVARGIVVITKKDLVDEELLGLVSLEAKDEVQGTTLAEAPILAVSALTGEGLSSLVSAIDHLLESTLPKKDLGRPRLPIDRVFTMKGFGTVVTGTLVDGQLSLGQEVEILPPGLRARIRGLQTHKRKIDTALPGSRVAANLTAVSTEELNRGYVISNPGWLVPTKAIDVKLRLLPHLTRPLPHNAVVTFHTGASEVVGKVRLLEGKKLEPGQSAWAQIELSRPVAAVRNDRFIIRSSDDTVGGGEIIEPHAKRYRRLKPGVIESLAAKASGGAEEIILSTLKMRGPVELEKLATLCNLSPDEVRMTVESLALSRPSPLKGEGLGEGEAKQSPKIVMLGGGEPGSLLISDEGWRSLVVKAQQAVQNYHRQFSLRRGMPREELRSRLTMPEQAFARLLQRLSGEGLLVVDGLAVRLPAHQIQLAREQQAAVDAFLKSLEQSPYSPPGELALDPELLNLLIEQGKVVKVSDSVVFAASAYEEMAARVIDYIKSRGKITVAEVRDLFQTSRKYALALMEYLDAQKVTRRVGDERVLR